MFVPVEVRYEIEALFAEYAAVLDGGDLERWPEFFTEQCLYEVIRMLKDRVVAIRDTMMYEPRYLRHVISTIRVTEYRADAIAVEANYAVFETLVDALTQVFNVGRYVDRLVREAGRLKFAEKHCVFDSLLVPTSLIYPI
jgi:salicylate 5-hydroxylase small subunit